MATNFSQETMQTILAEYQARVDALQKEIINLKKKLDANGRGMCFLDM